MNTLLPQTDRELTRYRISVLIQAVIDELGDQRFRSGDCHSLAMALLTHFGMGSLWICFRDDVDEETHEPFCSTYSHLIYTDSHNQDWDIDGIEATERWEESFEDNTADGLYNSFRWEHIENPQELQEIVTRNYGKYDADLTARIVAIFKVADLDAI